MGTEQLTFTEAELHTTHDVTEALIAGVAHRFHELENGAAG
jgi:hypothetical protein